MSSRFARVLSLAAGAGLTACVLVVTSAAVPAGATAAGAGNRALLASCARTVFGLGAPGATPVAGSADQQVIAQLAIFRRTRSPADALPPVSGLRAALAGRGARSFDPSAAVRLMHDRAGDAVYAVPAMVSVPALPAECARLPHFAGAGAFLAFRADEQGSGSGACLISTQLEARGLTGPPLPGAPTPTPARVRTITGLACHSEAILSGYRGALGDPLLGSGTYLALIPDGVATITYTVPDGRQLTVPVTGDLVHVPAAVISLTSAQRLRSPAQLGRALAALLPTTVTESGTGTSPTVTLSRPLNYITDAVGSFSFLRGLARSSSGSASASATGIGSVSCRARTHRCIAVNVTTTCDSHERCRTSRSIHRYRYVGAKPPPGTTRAQTLPTAPIVARANRLVTGPRKLTLVLSGTPEHVAVVLSVSCFSRNAAASGGGPVLKLAVPSRTPITLPGRAPAFHACDVAALVTSTARGPVHVSVARG